MNYKIDWEHEENLREGRHVALAGIAKQELIDDDLEFLKELWQNWTED